MIRNENKIKIIFLIKILQMDVEKLVECDLKRLVLRTWLSCLKAFRWDVAENCDFFRDKLQMF